MIGLFWIASVLTGCTSSEDTGGERVCEIATNGDTHCSGSLLNRCHATEDMAGHVHSTDCGAQGYTCVEVDADFATCADEEATCSLSEATCSEDGSASGNCVNGLLHVTLCESGSLCEIGPDGATCELTSADECSGHGAMTDSGCACETGYQQDPADPEACVVDPEALCTFFETTGHIHETLLSETLGEDEAGSGAFTASSEAPLMEVVEINLEAGTAGYVHFPVYLDGDYVVMLDGASPFDGFLHRDGSPVESTDLGAVSACSALLVSHHSGSGLVNDGGDQVPYVLALKGSEGASSVRLLLAHSPAALTD